MEIKNFGSLVAAAFLGSAITLGSFQLLDDDKATNSTSPSTTPVVKTSYNSSKTVEVPVNFTDAADKVMDAVVHIQSTQTARRTDNGDQDMRSLPEPFREFFGPYLRDGQGSKQRPRIGSGSGVIISNDGYIVTNNHVIDNADELEVTLHNNKSYTATVIGTDPTTDIALIKIDEAELSSLSLSDSDNARVGEWVLAVGNPFNLNSTVTAGIISAKGRNIGIIGENAIESFIQTDAAVNPGNSGGALVNLNGELVGINTAIASPTGAYSGYSFAVPSNLVSKVVEDLVKYGTVQRGWLGVSIQNINNDFEEHQNLSVSEGAYVAAFADNSSAKDAGIKEEDVIVAIDGNDIKTTAELIAYVGGKRPGDEVKIKVNRDGKEREYAVILKNKEGNTEIIKEEKNEVLLSLGLDLQELNAEEQEELGIDSGVKVTAIKPGKIRKYTDMKEGFIITKIDGKEVKDVSDILDQMEGKEGGVLIEGIYSKNSGNYYYGLGM